MSQFYELTEVQKNNGQNGQPVWIIIKGSVYDVTQFVDKHPGGGELILENAGKDATKAFNSAGHSSDAIENLKQYKIGEVVITKSAVSAPITNNNVNNINGRQEQPKPNSRFFCCF